MVQCGLGLGLDSRRCWLCRLVCRVGTGYAGLLRGESFAFGLIGHTGVRWTHVCGERRPSVPESTHQIAYWSNSSVVVAVVVAIVAVIWLRVLQKVLIVIGLSVLGGCSYFGELLFDLFWFHTHFLVVFFDLFFGLMFERVDIDFDPME